MQVAEGHLCYQRTSVQADAADGLSYPGRIAGEQFIVLRSTGEFHQTQLHDKVVYKLLDFLLGVSSCL